MRNLTLIENWRNGNSRNRGLKRLWAKHLQLCYSHTFTFSPLDPNTQSLSIPPKTKFSEKLSLDVNIINQ